MNPPDRPEHDTTCMKVDSRFSPVGNLHGETHLASTKHMGMRKFRLAAGDGDQPHERPYELAGYVLTGKAELTQAGRTEELREGTAYCVAAGMTHSFRILESPFECVEVTCPPSFVHDRDKAPGGR